jgi:hypothetical protein
VAEKIILPMLSLLGTGGCLEEVAAGARQDGGSSDCCRIFSLVINSGISILFLMRRLIGGLGSRRRQKDHGGGRA